MSMSFSDELDNFIERWKQVRTTNAANIDTFWNEAGDISDLFLELLERFEDVSSWFVQLTMGDIPAPLRSTKDWPDWLKGEGCE